MRFSTRILTPLTATFLGSSLAIAAEEPSEQVKRMDAAATVLDEIVGTRDKGIPEELLDSAKCVAVIPSMVKIGFFFGGRHGRGIATCRTDSGWSAPAPFTVTGGSWGLQIDGEAIDVVMLVMNDQGMEKMLSSKFKIGADASTAAGPQVILTADAVKLSGFVVSAEDRDTTVRIARSYAGDREVQDHLTVQTP